MDKKTLLITGAGSGIGATTAKLFADRGWYVGLYDLNPESVARVAREIGPDCCHGSMDVTDRDSVQVAFEHFSEQTGGRLDLLVNNAGLFEDRAFHEASPAFLDKMVDVNIKGVINCAHAAFPYLKQTPGGQLINIGSASSIYGIPMEATYSATKFFVRGLSEALELEWREHQIKVSVIMPSYVCTPMLENNDISWAAKDDKKILSGDDVAESVWKATHHHKLYWLLPFDSRLMMTLVKTMPLRWVPKLAYKLLYGKKQ